MLIDLVIFYFLKTTHFSILEKKASVRDENDYFGNSVRRAFLLLDKYLFVED